MTSPPHPSFLPGASGSDEFWQPVANRLPADWTCSRVRWPGAGNVPADPGISGYGDLIAQIGVGLTPGADLVAQSMGGVIAIGVAVAFPEKVRRIVLVATSGGLPVDLPAVTDWRGEYRRTFPDAAAWVTQERPDFRAHLSQITVPVLLIWGDADPISPPAVGERLADMLPDAHLHVIAGGTHDVAHDHPDEVAALIRTHLTDAAPPCPGSGVPERS